MPLALRPIALAPVLAVLAVVLPIPNSQGDLEAALHVLSDYVGGVAQNGVGHRQCLEQSLPDNHFKVSKELLCLVHVLLQQPRNEGAALAVGDGLEHAAHQQAIVKGLDEARDDRGSLGPRQRVNPTLVPALVPALVPTPAPALVPTRVPDLFRGPWPGARAQRRAADGRAMAAEARGEGPAFVDLDLRVVQRQNALQVIRCCLLLLGDVAKPSSQHAAHERSVVGLFAIRPKAHHQLFGENICIGVVEAFEV
mmetsp:Transcript_66200/g.187971  ORF Transcript_66200/g.187971 Transcript_66200/m.187971 type:complete len:253 (-) Transcript_66200:32-790(-)